MNPVGMQITDVYAYWLECVKNDMPGPLLDYETAQLLAEMCQKRGYKVIIEEATEELYEVNLE